MISSIYIKLPIVFVGVIVGSLVLASMLQIILVANIVLAVIGLGLFATFLAYLEHKNKIHFGHVPFIVGIFLILIGGGGIYGGIGIEGYKEKWWDLEDSHLGYLTIALIAGIITASIGLRMIIGNWYFLFRRK